MTTINEQIFNVLKECKGNWYTTQDIADLLNIGKPTAQASLSALFLYFGNKGTGHMLKKTTGVRGVNLQVYFSRDLSMPFGQNEWFNFTAHRAKLAKEQRERKKASHTPKPAAIADPPATEPTTKKPDPPATEPDNPPDPDKGPITSPGPARGSLDLRKGIRQMIMELLPEHIPSTKELHVTVDIRFGWLRD